MKERRGALPDILENSKFTPLETLFLTGFTGFQKKVYRAVSRIPKGRVRPYKWVAAEIGNPLAFRAVGRALNKNPYPGVIPCHRVVRSDGSIGGYSKGARLKKRMLEDEGLTVRRGAVIII